MIVIKRKEHRYILNSIPASTSLPPDEIHFSYSYYRASKGTLQRYVNEVKRYFNKLRKDKEETGREDFENEFEKFLAEKGQITYDI